MEFRPLLTKTIQINDIVCGSFDYEDIPQHELDLGAVEFVRVGGFVCPLIVRYENNKYTLIDGYFQYRCAVRASELYSDALFVNAIVVNQINYSQKYGYTDDKVENSISNQISLIEANCLRKSKYSSRG